MLSRMSRLTRGTAALAAVLVAGVGLAACGGSGVPSNSVATVDGQPITQATFNHWLDIAAKSASAQSTTGAAIPAPVPPDYAACVAYLQSAEAKLLTKGQKAPSAAELKSQCATEYQGYLTQVMQFLISADWVIYEGNKEGVNVTDKKVEQQFETLKSQEFPTATAFNSFLSRSGETLSDLLLQVKLQLLSTALRAKAEKGSTNVTPAAIQSYYNAHKSTFGTPESLDLQLILTSTAAKAAAAKAAVQSGTPFATVAKSDSIDVQTKNNGGVLDGVVRGQEEQSLDNAIFAAKVGALSGPIKTPFGYYVFRVTKVIPATQKSLDQAKAEIKATILATGQQSALTSWVNSFTKRWTQQTTCLKAYTVQDCKGYKAPKTSTGTTGATGG